MYECCMQQSVLLGNTGREGVLLAALSAAGQDRLRQCMNAAPAKNAARLHRQKLPTIIKKSAPVNGCLLIPWMMRVDSMDYAC